MVIRLAEDGIARRRRQDYLARSEADVPATICLDGHKGEPSRRCGMWQCYDSNVTHNSARSPGLASQVLWTY